MKKIKLNNEIGVDLEKLIESRMVILANSGGGKSFLIRRIVEQAVGNVQVILLDPEGEFASLREKYDFILAGKDADVPAEPRSASLLAIKLLELNKSAVIDLYELHPQERQRFVKLFCEALVNCPKSLYHPVIIVLDEAHEYVPEGKPSEATWAVEALAAKGRKRGQCLILASQRIAKMSKDAAAECNNKLVGRASQDIDMKRAGDELGFTKDRLFELRQLEPGEFFAFGPAISRDVIKLKIGDVNTKHQKVGYKGINKTPPPSEVIQKVLGELKDLPAEAEKEAKTVAELKKQLAEARREITNVGKKADSRDVSAPIQQKIVEKAVREAIAKQDKEWKQKMFDLQDEYLKQVQNWFKILRGIGESMRSYKIEIPQKPVFKSALVPEIRPGTIKAVSFVSNEIPPVEYLNLHKGDAVAEVDIELSTPQQKILNTLAWLETVGLTPTNKNQVAFLSDQSPKSSGYTNNLGTLRSTGMISYPRPGYLALTTFGRSRSVSPYERLTTETLHLSLKERLSSSQWLILSTLISSYPNSMSKTELAERSSQSSLSSGYTNNLGMLRALGLIDYPTPGMVVALPVLFIE